MSETVPVIVNLARRAGYEGIDGWRVPSSYKKCRGMRCPNAPVADMNRARLNSDYPSWWAYCADHLLVYNREVRDGQVWWRGTSEEAKNAPTAEDCRHGASSLHESKACQKCLAIALDAADTAGYTRAVGELVGAKVTAEWLTEHSAALVGAKALLKAERERGERLAEVVNEYLGPKWATFTQRMDRLQAALREWERGR